MTIEEFEKHVDKRLKEEREKQNISQLELSYMAGISQNMITYIENGRRTPTLTTILKLCNALKINPSVLFQDRTLDDSISERESAKRTVLELVQRFM